MAVIVLIRRKVASGKGGLLENLYREPVALTLRQKGYISAETMERTDLPDEYLVISMLGVCGGLVKMVDFGRTEGLSGKNRRIDRFENQV